MFVCPLAIYWVGTPDWESNIQLAYRCCYDRLQQHKSLLFSGTNNGINCRILSHTYYMLKFDQTTKNRTLILAYASTLHLKPCSHRNVFEELGSHIGY